MAKGRFVLTKRPFAIDKTSPAKTTAGACFPNERRNYCYSLRINSSILFSTATESDSYVFLRINC